MYQRAFLRSSTSPLSRQPASYVLDHVAIVERQRVGLDVLDGAGYSASVVVLAGRLRSGLRTGSQPAGPSEPQDVGIGLRRQLLGLGIIGDA